jgi:hypothetical protein
MMFVIEKPSWNGVIYISKSHHSATCQFLMDGWKLVLLAWCYGCNCSEVAQWLKMNCFKIVAIELQWIAPHIWWIATIAAYATCIITLTLYKYSELQMIIATQKLNYKANCKTSFFFKPRLHILCFWPHVNLNF